MCGASVGCGGNGVGRSIPGFMSGSPEVASQGGGGNNGGSVVGSRSVVDTLCAFPSRLVHGVEGAVS